MNSILERVNTVCQAVRNMSNSPVTFKKLIAVIRKEFKENEIDLSLKTKKDKTLNTDYFYVEAFYDAEDDFNGDTPIEVVMYHNFPDTNKFEKPQVTDILIQLFDAVTHELKHQVQSRKRNYIVFSEHAQEPYSKYLADPDELDAYSFSIAIELLRYMPKDRAERYMSKITVLGKIKRGTFLLSPILSTYIGEFKNNPIIAKLSKKVYKHIKTIDTNLIFK
jgi:hypothetical protein